MAPLANHRQLEFSYRILLVRLRASTVAAQGIPHIWGLFSKSVAILAPTSNEPVRIYFALLAAARLVLLEHADGVILFTPATGGIGAVTLPYDISLRECR